MERECKNGFFCRGHPSGIYNCDDCGDKVKCKVLCSRPKSWNLNYQCSSCRDKERQKSIDLTAEWLKEKGK